METLPAISEQEQKDQQLIKGGIDLFQSVPELIQSNKTSRMKAEFAVTKFLAKVEENGGVMNAELDKEANDLIVKVKATGTKMEEKRKGFSQVFTAINKIFTGLEKEVDTLAAQLQPLRDSWAKEVIAEAEKRQKEAAEKAAIDTAKANLKGWIIAKIGELGNAFVFNKKEAWTASFNAITLETLAAKTKGLNNLKTTVLGDDLLTTLSYELPYISKLNAEAVNAVKMEAHAEYDFDGWAIKAATELHEFKMKLVDRLPSKKAELEEAAEKLRLQKEKEEAEAKAAAERQKAIDAANGEKKKQLEEQQRIADENERIRKQNAAEQFLKDEADRKQREKEEQDKLAAEKEKADQDARNKGEMAASEAVAQTLFNEVLDGTPDTQAPEARQGYEIKVTNPAGYVLLFQNWYQEKGMALDMDAIEKTTIKQMKTFAEAQAKEGKTIESKLLRYEKSVKAVNRKEK